MIDAILISSLVVAAVVLWIVFAKPIPLWFKGLAISLVALVDLLWHVTLLSVHLSDKHRLWLYLCVILLGMATCLVGLRRHKSSHRA